MLAGRVAAGTLQHPALSPGVLVQRGLCVPGDRQR